MRHRLRRGSLDGVVVAVQGLGHVGMSLCQLLRREGAELVVSDIDDAAVERAESEFDATTIAPQDVYDVDAEVLAPCALGAVINDETVPRLRVALLNVRGDEITNWSFTATAAALAPGDATGFTTSYRDPPENARGVEVTFAASE